MGKEEEAPLPWWKEKEGGKTPRKKSQRNGWKAGRRGWEEGRGGGKGEIKDGRKVRKGLASAKCTGSTLGIIKQRGEVLWTRETP